MFWFYVLKGLLNLAGTVAQYMADKQLLKAGEYKQIAQHNADALKKISNAQRARDDIINDPDSMPINNDQNNRDN